MKVVAGQPALTGGCADYSTWYPYTKLRRSMMSADRQSES